ncbi:hypothetical protein MC885_002657, partial [Smutsia gigantea]
RVAVGGCEPSGPEDRGQARAGLPFRGRPARCGLRGHGPRTRPAPRPSDVRLAALTIAPPAALIKGTFAKGTDHRRPRHAPSAGAHTCRLRGRPDWGGAGRGAAQVSSRPPTSPPHPRATRHASPERSERSRTRPARRFPARSPRRRLNEVAS